MIRFGLRLTLRSGKESLTRLVVMALAVTVGVTMLLATLGIINGLNAQNTRGAWLTTTAQGSIRPSLGHHPRPPATSSGAHSIWWFVKTDTFENQSIVEVDVAAAKAHPLALPGIAQLPGPGQYYASPALELLLKATPADELADRFPGTVVGTIGPSALPSPSDLVVVVGQSSRVLDKVPGAGEISHLATSSVNGGPDSYGTTGLQIVLGVLALVLLFPVLVFVGTATRLSAARREQRFAAMRLAGATMRQIAVIAAVEALVAALGGVALGFALFYLVKPALAHIPFTGQSLATGDVSLGLVDVLIVVIGVPLAAAGVARAALRRVRITPLGVSRRVTPTPPRFYRVLPLLSGIAVLAYFVADGKPGSSNGQIEAYLLGFALMMVGLVMAGPWLTMTGSRILSQRTRRPSLLLSGRRLADNPRGAFRAISGLVLAIFVTSVSVGTISTLLTDHGSTSSTLASKTVTDQFAFNANNDIASVPSGLVRSLRLIPGVTGVTVVYVAPSWMRTHRPIPDINRLGGDLDYGLASCAQLASTPALGRCAPGASYAALGDDIAFMPLTKSVSTAASTTWPTAALSRRPLDLPVQLIAVATNGSASAIARSETVFDQTLPFASSVTLFGEAPGPRSQFLVELQTSSEVVILVSLLIAGCSLAVAMAAGISERKRPFSLLRLTGVPLGVLRRVVALETAAPLVIIAITSATLGLIAADLFLRSQLDLTLRLPGLTYYLIVLGGLIGSLAIIGSTLPILERVTRPEDARVE